MIIHSYWEFFVFRSGRRFVNTDRDTVGVFITRLDEGVEGWCLCCEGGAEGAEVLDYLFRRTT
jgi:hypothetical protein